MNMQNIQILFLLLDSIMMLAPWRIVTRMVDRIGYAASKRLARNLCIRSLCIRSLGIIALACAVLYVFPPVSMSGAVLGAVLGAGDLTSAMVSHLRIGNPLISIMLFGCYLGALLWGGLWLWRRSPRALMPLWSGFCLTDH
jgi:DoxX-like family